MTSALSISQAIENIQPFPLPGLVRRNRGSHDCRPRFMGLFRRILRNRIGRPRFMGSFRRIPRRHLRRPRFMGLNARKKAAPEMQSSNLVPGIWHLVPRFMGLNARNKQSPAEDALIPDPWHLTSERSLP